MLFIQFLFIRSFLRHTQGLDIDISQRCFETQLFRPSKDSGDAFDWICDDGNSFSEGIDSENIAVLTFAGGKVCKKTGHSLRSDPEKGDIPLNQGWLGGFSGNEKDMISISKEKQKTKN